MNNFLIVRERHDGYMYNVANCGDIQRTASSQHIKSQLVAELSV